MGLTKLCSIPCISALLPLLALCACGGGGSSTGTPGGGGGGGGPKVISISLVEPSSYMVGMPSPLIRVHGQNFNFGSQAQMDGVPALLTTFESLNVIDAEFPDYPPVGVHQITVSGTNTSNALPLTIYAPQHGPQMMQAVPGFLTGLMNPMSITAADLNHDGRSDVITTGVGSGSNQVVVMYGQADGTLSAPQSIPLHEPVNTVLAGDVDGDGNPDLVAVQVGANLITVTVLLGNGQGNFQPVSSPQTFAGNGSGPGYLVDIDGDGKPDLVLGYQPSAIVATQEIAWLKNTGGGSFAPPTTLASNTANDFGFVVSDFDGDGKTDIVYAAAGPPQALRYLKNLGSGQFSDQPVAGLNGAFGSPTVVDFNLDGIPDLVVEGNGVLYSFAGNGDGSFTLVATGAIPGLGAKIQFVVGDFDHDGFPDLAGQSGNSRPASMVYLFGDGHGNFTPQIVVGPMGNYAATGDFNGDGLPDVVIPDPQDFVSVSLGRTDRNFASPFALNFAATFANISIGDVLGNGLPDILVAGDSVNPGTLFQNEGNNSFQVAASTDPNSFALEDLTGRGVADLIGDQSGQVVVWPNNGSIDFSGSSPMSIAPYTTAIQIADMDGDGHPDIVTGGEILYGKGAYQFTPVAMSQITWPYIIGDFNGDGKLDIAVGVSTYLNSGNRSFQTVQNSGINLSNLQTWAVGDFNGDGKDDIAVVSFGESEIVLWYSNGDGTFYNAAYLDCGQFPDALQTGDFGGNGRVDLVVALQGSYQACILFNQGNGLFTRSFFASGADALEMRTRDLNGDHKPDLVISNFFRPANATVIFHK